MSCRHGYLMCLLIPLKKNESLEKEFNICQVFVKEDEQWALPWLMYAVVLVVKNENLFGYCGERFCRGV